MVTVEKLRPGALVELALQVAGDVADPEIPVVTLADLGIVRGVEIDGKGRAVVELTPTYSGCPAVQVIENDVAKALQKAGIPHRIKRVISPPWTTAWISAAGREKLTAYGIAPPIEGDTDNLQLFSSSRPPCPRCESGNTSLISQFGSTPCKAHHRCDACGEPFDYFKCL